MIAVMRQRMSRVEAGLQDHLAVLALDELAVNGDLGHRASDGTPDCEEFHQGAKTFFVGGSAQHRGSS